MFCIKKERKILHQRTKSKRDHQSQSTTPLDTPRCEGLMCGKRHRHDASHFLGVYFFGAS